jgi:hypothetical protein
MPLPARPGEANADQASAANWKRTPQTMPIWAIAKLGGGGPQRQKEATEWR